MIKSYNQILQEVGDACDYVRGGGEILNAEIDGTTSGLQLAHMADGDLVENYLPEMLKPEPSEIVVQTPEEVDMTYCALGYIHDVFVPRDRIDETLHHEGAHAAAASTYFADVEYRLMVLDSKPREKTFDLRPYTAFARPLEGLTKLAIASVTAAPSTLSPGDEARLIAMGYRGQADVARRIRMATDPRLASLVLPEPFRLKLAEQQKRQTN